MCFLPTGRAMFHLSSGRLDHHTCSMCSDGPPLCWFYLIQQKAFASHPRKTSRVTSEGNFRVTSEGLSVYPSLKKMYQCLSSSFSMMASCMPFIKSLTDFRHDSIQNRDSFRSVAQQQKTSWIFWTLEWYKWCLVIPFWLKMSWKLVYRVILWKRKRSRTRPLNSGLRSQVWRCNATKKPQFVFG